MITIKVNYTIGIHLYATKTIVIRKAKKKKDFIPNTEIIIIHGTYVNNVWSGAESRTFGNGTPYFQFF